MADTHILPNATNAATAPVTELWYTRCPAPTTSGIATHLGFVQNEFACDNIAVKSIRASDDQKIRRSHYDHSHPRMFREGGNVPPLWTRGNGANTALVGITWVDEEQRVLVRPDSDIKHVRDLKGRKLGLSRSASEIVDIARAEELRGFLTALQLGGLEPKDVEFIDIAGGDFDLKEQNTAFGERRKDKVARLLSGEFDAIYAKGAVSATLIKEQGLRPIVDFNTHKDPLVRVNAGTPRPITVDRDLALHRPDIVARYLAVLLRTAEWAQANPHAVVSAIAGETGAEESNVRIGYGPELHKKFQPKLSIQYVAGLNQQKNYLHEWGFINDFAFNDWIAEEPLSLAHKLVAAGQVKLGA